jgi:hypothetical protein
MSSTLNIDKILVSQTVLQPGESRLSDRLPIVQRTIKVKNLVRRTNQPENYRKDRGFTQRLFNVLATLGT